MIMMFAAREPLCTSLGRNGPIKTYGLEVQRWHKAAGDTVNLIPVRKNGDQSRCTIELPVADIPRLIAELQKALNEN